MKIKREMPLGQALDEVSRVAQGIKSGGSAVVDGQEYKLDDPVLLEIEFEAAENKAELEFEIKWRHGSRIGELLKKVVPR